MLAVIVGSGLPSCGPTIVPPSGSGGGSASGGGSTSAITGTSTSAGSSEGTTGSTSDDGVADSTSGDLPDPSGPCPEPIPGVTMLWCGDLDPEGPLATDGTWVYFDTADESLWRVPVAGGVAQGLAGSLGDLRDLEVVDGRVYFTSFFAGSAGSVSTEGGAVQWLSQELFKPNAIAVADGWAFVTQYGEDLPLVRIVIETGEATDLYPGLSYAGLAFVSDDSLWFATESNDGNTPTPVWRGNTVGGPPQLVIDPTVVVEDLELEGTTLWWARYLPDDSGIMATELTDPPSTTTVLQVSAHPRDLALTTERVVWREHSFNSDPRYEERIQSIARDGSDLQLLLLADEVGPVVATPAGVASTMQEVNPEHGTVRGAVIVLGP